MSKLIIHSSSALFDGPYRYYLWRQWDITKPTCMFIGLNPSTADATTDDPTIRRCIAYANSWGYGALYMGNLFAFKATDPDEMLKARCPIGYDNDNHLYQMYCGSSLTIAAWGKHGKHLRRDEQVIQRLAVLHCLKRNQDGTPSHPLYLPKNLTPIKYESKPTCNS